MPQDQNDNTSWDDALRQRLELGRTARRILGVEESAGPDEIRSAWRRCSLACHPDRNPNDPQAHRRFIRVNAACRFLLEGVAPDVPLEDADTNDDADAGGCRSHTEWGYFAWWRENYFGNGA